MPVKEVIIMVNHDYGVFELTGKMLSKVSLKSFSCVSRRCQNFLYPSQLVGLRLKVIGSICTASALPPARQISRLRVVLDHRENAPFQGALHSVRCASLASIYRKPGKSSICFVPLP